MHKIAFLVAAWLCVFTPFLELRPAVMAAEPVVIEADQSVEVDFPSSVTFHLSATSPQPVDRVELRYSSSGKEYSNAAAIDMDLSTDVTAEYTLDAQVEYIEPGVEITYHWELIGEEGPVARTSDESFTWVDQSLGWKQYDSADVSVFAYDDDTEFDTYVLQVAQESADHYKTMYDIESIQPVRIWMYADQRDFSNTLQQNSESWIGGFSLPDAGVIAVPIDAGDDYSVKRVITHEVSHHVLYQATRNPFTYVATWLDEGLAVYGQSVGNETDEEQVLAAYENGMLPTLRTLTSSFPTDPAAANLSYAASHSAVDFIIENWGEESIRDIIRSYRTGVTSDDTLEAALGLDTDGLDLLWRAWLDAKTDS